MSQNTKKLSNRTLHSQKAVFSQDSMIETRLVVSEVVRVAKGLKEQEAWPISETPLAEW